MTTRAGAEGETNLSAEDTPEMNRLKMDSPPSPSPAAAYVVSKVLDDDDLLREIFVRVGLAPTLVRAALVCKRWFRHASDPAFLCRFRQLHPPRLLGLYVQEGFGYDIPTVLPRFVPMVTQAEDPELAAVLRRMASLNLDIDDKVSIVECRNGSVSIAGFRNSKYTYEVHSPLFPERGVAVLPSPPVGHTILDDGNTPFLACFLSKGGDGCLPYKWLAMEIFNIADKMFGKVYMLGEDGVWVMHTEATTQGLPFPQSRPEPMLINDKIYMPAGTSYDMLLAGGHSSDILVLDLANSSFFRIQAPEGVEWFRRYKYGTESHNRDTVFSRADDSGIYLIDVKELQLLIWLHKDDNWLLVDTICLREMCVAFGMSDGIFEDGHTDALWISKVGDNAEFVFLRTGRCAFYLDIRRRVLRKVYDVTENDKPVGQIHPFMMIWPPTFPVLQDDLTRNAV